MASMSLFNLTLVFGVVYSATKNVTLPSVNITLHKSWSLRQMSRYLCVRLVHVVPWTFQANLTEGTILRLTYC